MFREVHQGRQYRSRPHCEGYEEHPGGDGEGLEDGRPFLEGCGLSRHPVYVLLNVVEREIDGIFPLESFIW